jgi:2-keto-3-deoxy-L-fuconate dehydrogenase
MHRMEGKRALVTAAGQGIGRASALRLAREGASVLATDIDAAALAALASEEAGPGSITTRVMDVRDPAAITAGVSAAGRIDALVSCAGFVANGTILDCDEDTWAFSLDLNLTATYRLIRAALPGMIAQGGGAIVTIASVASSVIAAPNRFVYGATKAGLIGLTKALAADFVSQGIRANAVCPGTVDSPSLNARLHATGDYAAARAAFTARQPMGRIATADEIAALVAYLASDDSSFTTGAIHVIDGGWSNV